ncbi:MAG: sensor domain-containing diguanylate cyclase [Pseudomonadales bacterium]
MSTFFEGLIQNIPAICYRSKCDKDSTMYFINDAIESLSGYPASDFINNETRSFSSIIHSDDLDFVINSIYSAVHAQQLWSIEYRINNSSDQEIWVTETGVAIFNDTGQLEYLDGFIQDISERKRMELALRASEKQIRDMAFTDTVTGLANRNLFTDRIDQFILESKRYHNEFALFFIDLDKFKDVNDSHGHLVGDKLLSMAAERISTSFRESDVVARFGGDEFLVLFKNTSCEQEVSAAATKLLSKLAAPYYVDNLELSVTGSIGITLCPRDSNNSSDLIRNADKAMYKAKESGKNCFSLFSKDNKNSLASEAQ